MANYVASQLNAAQAKFSKRFQEPELRRKQNPALNLALKNLTATIPTHTELRNREDRAVTANLFKRRPSTNGTARTARPNGSKGDSIATGLSWQTISETFSISMKQGDANVFSTQEMLMNELYQVAQNLHDRIGTILLNYLLAHRSNAPLATPVGGTWDNTNQAYEIAAADRTYFFQKLASLMNQHNWRGMLDIIADPATYQLAQQLRAQGSQNATNLTFQFDNTNIVQTTEVINANYTAGSALAMPEGSFALLPWIPPVNRRGKGDYDDYNGGWGTMEDPLGSTITQLNPETGESETVPLEFAVYAYSQASDDQGNNGGSQDLVTTFEVSIDIAPTLPPLSTANESAVIEFGQVAA